MITSANADFVLCLRGVSKTFGATKALRGIDFEVRRGEVHALVGQNGSGKSTLIKLLAGVHQPDAPTTGEFGGVRFRLGDGPAAHAAGLRFVHQDLGIVPALDTRDNLALGFGYPTGFAGRVRWRAQSERARGALAALGYELDVRAPLADLAPVERTAVAIARALQGIETGPSLLVLDEPTAAMPNPEVSRLFEVVDSVRDAGVSVLYVSHHLDEIYALADRVTVLRDGRVVARERVGDLPRRELVRLMVGEVPAVRAQAARSASDRVALSVTGLSARRLRGCTFSLRAGEVVGVAGLTGSGREELCAAVFGGRSRGGTARVGDRVVEARRPDLMVRNGVGLVPAKRREEAVVSGLSVRENFTLPDVRRYWKRWRLRRGSETEDVTALLTRMRVKAAGPEAGIDALSGGNQQKVVVGRWLRLEPAVLLLDDPTQGVDIAAKNDLHRLIDEVAAAGTAVLVCSTDEAELERLCDRVLVLRGGRVAAELAAGVASASRIAHEILGADDPDAERRRP
ncbi:sugar ABC transporter ATP-binding protein [Amycolatopsis rhabdoformis]|uniref:Sugar ABC transporter ATP-binding protein n=1 Tax=Amycolatopsis rhabdoformis TaxID=1448059 RepID=A0ABZ1IDL1_9PSEU|nr:sugar ABC transporter ATP-binding protein [Amycolatopsis rhabdoformis]WSE32248.1 sugar ABC transporter ATP-binding protein [Amycolatopsis rhabdoformis]